MVRHFWEALTIFLLSTQLILPVSCGYIDVTNREQASSIGFVHRPQGTYYGMEAFGQIGMTFDGDTIEIAKAVDYTHTIAAGGTKTYKINWQEYDSTYSTSKDIQCVPLTEITTGKTECFWFKYFEDYDFILWGYTSFDEFQTIELHKEN